MKSISIFILHILLVALSSCDRTKAEGIDHQIDRLGIRETIVNQGEEVDRYVKNKGFRTWQLSTAEILQIREIFSNQLYQNEFNFIKEPKEDVVLKYYRQYFPYINDLGERMVYVNALCDSLESESSWLKGIDWKNELISIDDGGNCYWQVTLNLDKNTYSNFMVNGM